MFFDILARFVVRPIRHAYSFRPNFGGFTSVEYWARIQNYNRLAYLSSPLTLNKIKMNYYRLYAKFEGQTKYKAIDLSTGAQVINLIYATMIPASNVQKLAKMMYEHNPNLDWKITKIK